MKPVNVTCYMKASANIITTGSYQSAVEGYKTYLNMDKDESLEVIRNSVRLARQGIEMAQRQTGNYQLNITFIKYNRIIPQFISGT